MHKIQNIAQIGSGKIKENKNTGKQKNEISE